MFAYSKYALYSHIIENIDNKSSTLQIAKCYRFMPLNVYYHVTNKSIYGSFVKGDDIRLV